MEENAETLKEQVGLCRQRLASLVRGIEQGDETARPEPLGVFLDGVLTRWAAMRPEVELKTTRDLATDPRIVPDETLSQALINLLNNAADASLANGSRRVEAHLHSDDERLVVEIEDRGRGFTNAQARLAGRVSFSTKQNGLGIGLVLSHATLSRLGGSLVLHPANGGQLTRITLPLDRLRATRAESPHPQSP